MFHLGQKVICISDDWRPAYADCVLPDNMPRYGVVYTVRGFVEWESYLGLLLEEIVNRMQQYDGREYEPSFGHRSFRPLVERKTDISIFQQLLKTRELVE